MAIRLHCVYLKVNGRGDTVVLVPGGLTGWLSWEPHSRMLSKNYRVVRVQLVNVELGLLGKPLPADYSVDYETEALRLSLSKRNIESAHLVGWSYGGEIALNYALSNPGKVRSLCLIEPAAFWVLKREASLSEETEGSRRITGSIGPGDVSESQLEWFSHASGLVPDGVDPRTLPQWPIWVQHRQSLRMGDAPYRHEDSLERVRGFDRPVLLFKGEGSARQYLDVVDVLVGEFPDAEVRTLPGGHACHIVSINEFMDVLTPFLLSS